LLLVVLAYQCQTQYKTNNIWPQQHHQKQSCGFPQARICACFDLESELLISHEIDSKKSSELPLLRKQQKYLNNGDIFLGHKGLFSYYDLSKLFVTEVLIRWLHSE